MNMLLILTAVVILAGCGSRDPSGSNVKVYCEDKSGAAVAVRCGDDNSTLSPPTVPQ